MRKTRRVSIVAVKNAIKARRESYARLRPEFLIRVCNSCSNEPKTKLSPWTRHTQKKRTRMADKDDSTPPQLWSCAVIHHRKLKAQFVTDDTMPRMENKTEHLVPVGVRAVRSFILFVMRPYKRALRDTIILSATRYTTYDWHARSVATYVYTGTFHVLLFCSPSFPTDRLSLSRAFPCRTRFAGSRECENWSRAIEGEIER